MSRPVTRTAVILALAAAIAAPAPAIAAAEAAHPAFGNTLEVIYPDGRLARLWLEPDGSYRGQNWHGLPSSGRWLVKPGKLCMKQRRPLPVPIYFCTPLMSGGVGASWLSRAVTGETVRVRLVAGR